MKKKYQRSSRVKCAHLQALRRDFETLQMKDNESITNYRSKTMEIANKMHFHGEKMEVVVIVEKILRSLAPRYNYVVWSIEESKDIDSLLLDELQIQGEEVEVEVEEEVKEMVAGGIEMNQFFKAKGETIINFRTTVSFGNHSQVTVMGKGDIQIKTKNDNIDIISNVFYIPDLRNDVLSMGQLQEKGYTDTIKEGICEIYDPKRGLIAQVKMSQNRLFPLQIQTIQLVFQ
ncbi:uncharacterized protein LOC111386325 [Olea europaea var. sylvestris]|uniref:uncharacterized protein LOC111386325 n=1 Tax=Olea europaea var. sylvestris TaxID=158386 RepID=UPI000C1CE032|nr:uncharacterized protein LOC111386325 [Olea europaea var. sylvestris]